MIYFWKQIWNACQSMCETTYTILLHMPYNTSLHNYIRHSLSSETMYKSCHVRSGECKGREKNMDWILRRVRATTGLSLIRNSYQKCSFLLMPLSEIGIFHSSRWSQLSFLDFSSTPHLERPYSCFSLTCLFSKYSPWRKWRGLEGREHERGEDESERILE